MKYQNLDNRVILGNVTGKNFMATIKILCDCCKKITEVPLTEEIPEDVKYLKCNFCPDCMGEMNDHYSEDYIYLSDNISDPVPPNQLDLF